MTSGYYTYDLKKHAVIAGVMIVMIMLACMIGNATISGKSNKGEGQYNADAGFGAEAEPEMATETMNTADIPEEREQIEERPEENEPGPILVSESILARAAEYANENNYEMAASIVNEALKYAPDDENANKLFHEYETLYLDEVKSEAVETAKASADAGDYESAFESIVDGLKVVEGDEELKVLRDEYRELYRNALIEKAKTVYEAEGLEAAVEVLRERSSYLASDEQISDLVAGYDGRKPVALSSLEPFLEENDMDYYESETDNFGNPHNDIITTTYGGTFEACVAADHYRIDQRFDRLSGTVFLTEDGKNTGYEGKIMFFAEDFDHPIYNCDGITAGFEPVDFDIDISGVKDLIILVESPGYIWGSGYHCVSNVQLHPKFTLEGLW